MANDAEILTVTPTLVLGRYGDVCIALPRGGATVDGVGRIREGMTTTASRAGCPGIGVLFLVGEKVGPPSGPARAAVSEMFKALRPNIKVISAVLEGSGFIASAKRSIFTWA